MATEEITLGDIDAIDELCVISMFDEAAKYLSGASKIKLSNDQKLQFYALFKQATEGPCVKPKPGLLEMVERAKWNAWHSLGKMQKDVAVAEYIKLLDSIAPQWREQLGDIDNSDDEEEKGSSRNDGGGLDISPTLSRPVVDTDVVAVKDRDLLHWVSEGDISKVQAALSQGESLSQVNADGQNALHLSVDRGHDNIVDFLMKHSEAKSLLSQRDNDGFTPLHFACACERPALAARLVSAGADPEIKSNDDETSWDLSSEAVKSAMKQAKAKDQ